MQHDNFTLNRSKSTDTEFDHPTADTSNVFKVKRS